MISSLPPIAFCGILHCWGRHAFNQLLVHARRRPEAHGAKIVFPVEIIEISFVFYLM
jgi:hypothetical protein